MNETLQCPYCRSDISPGSFCACGNWAYFSTNPAVNVIKMTGLSPRYSTLKTAMLINLISTGVLFLVSLFSLVPTQSYGGYTEYYMPRLNISPFTTFLGLAPPFIAYLGILRHISACRDLSQGSVNIAGLRLFKGLFHVLFILVMVVFGLIAVAVLVLSFTDASRSSRFYMLLFTLPIIALYLGIVGVLVIPYILSLLRMSTRAIVMVQTGVMDARVSNLPVVYQYIGGGASCLAALVAMTSIGQSPMFGFLLLANGITSAVTSFLTASLISQYRRNLLKAAGIPIMYVPASGSVTQPVSSPPVSAPPPAAPAAPTQNAVVSQTGDSVPPPPSVTPPAPAAVESIAAASAAPEAPAVENASLPDGSSVAPDAPPADATVKEIDNAAE